MRRKGVRREPDVVFPYISDDCRQLSMWVDEGILRYSSACGSSFIEESKSKEEVIELLELITIKNMSEERRRIAANYLVERELL